ncbi:MAG: metal ABC transporter substrate-binding protein [Peptococcaceae bacterium]|jgi:zinc transport system substrate-binding protein|nr:metal ABC transporter substrate-binding protein [Peptococcaceae bacterium]
MRKICRILFLGWIILFGLAACGGGQAAPAGPGASAAAAQPGAAPAAEPAETPATAPAQTPTQGETLSVRASFYPMYDFAVKIGGDKVAVVNMVPAGTEPHDWEPAAADIVGLENAAVFVYNGAGMEHWAEDVLAALENRELVIAEASEGVPLLAGHHDHDDEDEAEDEDEEEEGYDPHVWLDPARAKIVMENIRNAFTQADPANQAVYEANYERYAAELDELDKTFRDTLAPLPNKDIIVAHEAFGYLCAAYGLNQVPIEGLSPDSEPDPARMAEIIDFARERQIKVIFFEELVSPKVAETIAAATGAATAVLNPIEGLSDEEQAAGEDYFSLMRQNLAALTAALS